jgi:uroporphyrinogen-III decarboxylase
VDFLDDFIEAGFDILNPVQISARGMDPEFLKIGYGDRLVFWGGGVDTQRTLPFGSPAEVRREVAKNVEVFSRGGGYVFTPVHNIQAKVPVGNIIAAFDVE